MKLPEQDSDPVLKQAMAEILSIINKYDIGGSVILQSKTHSEYSIEISPSWSCMELQHIGAGEYGIRFKAQMATGSETEKERGRLTVGMILGFAENAEFIRHQFLSMAGVLGKYLKIEHTSKFTPHNPDK